MIYKRNTSSFIDSKPNVKSVKIPESNHVIENMKILSDNATAGKLLKLVKVDYKEAEQNTLMSLLLGNTELSELLKPYEFRKTELTEAENEAYKKLAHSLAALVHRNQRFFLKYNSIKFLLEKAPRKNLVLIKHFEMITKELYTKKIYVNAEGKTPSFSVTPESTIKLIKTTLNHLETRLKDMLSSLASLYNIENPLDHYWFNYPKLRNAIEEILPLHFKGWCHDYHYVFQAMNITMFDEKVFSNDQLKQFRVLETEILELLVLLRYKDSKNLNLAMLLESESNVMNIPREKFLKEPLSKESFSRFITVMSRLIISLYPVVLLHLLKEENQESSNPDNL